MKLGNLVWMFKKKGMERNEMYVILFGYLWLTLERMEHNFFIITLLSYSRMHGHFV